MDLRNTPFPESVCIRVTRRCNAACAFCQAPNTDRAEIPLAVLGGVFAALADHGVRSVKLSGGEPTLRGDLPGILDGIAGQGMRAVVITNGMLLRPDVVRALVAGGGELKVSIHRPGPANDEVLRVRSFDRVLANLGTALAAGIPVSVNTVVADASEADLRAMVGFAAGVGAWKISFIPVVPRGRAAGQGEFALADPALDRLRARIARLAREFAPRITVRCIDFRRNDYWIIENNGTVWIERAAEETDIKLGDIGNITAVPRAG